MGIISDLLAFYLSGLEKLKIEKLNQIEHLIVPCQIKVRRTGKLKVKMTSDVSSHGTALRKVKINEH